MNPTKTFDITTRSSKLIYRDLIKMVKKTRPETQQKAVLALLRKEFDKNKSISNVKDIELLKRNAAKSIADTYVYYIKEEYMKTIKK